MSEEIPNALTPEEWATKRVQEGYSTRETAFDCDCVGFWIDPADNTLTVGIEYEGCNRDTMLDRHKAAALALYGQPYGFTHEDVRWLRALIDEAADNSQRQWAGVAAGERILAKIAALLPPEVP